MMLNKFPKDTDLQSILFYLGEAPKWGARNRALFALRQILRIKDIAGLRVSDVLGVGADSNLSHRADRNLSQGWKPTLRTSAVDKCSF